MTRVDLANEITKQGGRIGQTDRQINEDNMDFSFIELCGEPVWTAGCSTTSHTVRPAGDAVPSTGYAASFQSTNCGRHPAFPSG